MPEPSPLLVAILAAGASRRLGQPKQLIPIDGEPLLRRQCRIAIDARIGPVVAILGCGADACAAAIADLQIMIRTNDGWEEGLASSIREATRAAIEMNAAGLLILHGDQYRITATDLRALQAAWMGSKGSNPCRARNGSYLGPPVIIPTRCFDSALRLTGDEGAKGVLTRESVIDVPMPSAAHDLDTPDQLAALGIP